LRSKTKAVVRVANGISRTSFAASSVAPSSASSPPMIRIVVEAKKDGLVERFCTTTPSMTRFSRAVVCSIQRRR